LSNYSIKDLETLSGIKAHTLRIWEQRYNIIEPKRSDTNIRSYDDDDLKKILNISLLNHNGFKISKIAGMSAIDINQSVLNVAQESLKYPDHVHNLMVSMMEMDENGFDKIISKCILQFGLEKTMIHVVYPFLNKLGLLWQIGTISPYQEHFISNLIRQKIIVSIDNQTFENNYSKKYLLFLPESEMHEIGLLFANYILKSRGFKVYYFGQTLPFDDLLEACQTCKPDYTFTVMTSLGLQDTEMWIENIATHIPNVTHVVTGNQDFLANQTHKNIFFAKNAEAFIDFLG
jgi:DNA-binding transcriptional MerR regulator